jgi:hypothetical protein
MRRRFLFFGIGAFISIFFLSMGPENRLKTTLYAYLDYFNMDKRVITHLVNQNTKFSNIAECQLVYYNISKADVLLVLQDGEVDFDLSNPKGEPCQQYVVNNSVNDFALRVNFELCYYNNKSVEVLSFVLNGGETACDF